MNFQEIIPGTKVVVNVTNGTDMQARFISRVIRNTGKYLLVIPFMHRGIRVKFVGRNVRINLEIRTEQGVTWSFKNCHITAVRKDGLVYHRIATPVFQGIENRRGEKRMYLWEPQLFSIEGMKDTLYTTLKDIGTSGFSFVIDHKKKMDLMIGIGVACKIKEKNDNIIDVQGSVIRKEKMEKYTVYGCKMLESSVELSEYLQRLEARNTIVDDSLSQLN